jgi:hypothetical protein
VGQEGERSLENFIVTGPRIPSREGINDVCRRGSTPPTFDTFARLAVYGRAVVGEVRGSRAERSEGQSKGKQGEGQN